MPLETLEKRGNGVMGKWDTRLFRFGWTAGREAAIEWFAPEVAESAQGVMGAEPKGRVLASQISELALEESACEFSFAALGRKIRLRAKTAESAVAWVKAVSGQLPAKAAGSPLDMRIGGDEAPSASTIATTASPPRSPRSPRRSLATAQAPAPFEHPRHSRSDTPQVVPEDSWHTPAKHSPLSPTQARVSQSPTLNFSGLSSPPTSIASATPLSQSSTSHSLLDVSRDSEVHRARLDDLHAHHARKLQRLEERRLTEKDEEMQRLIDEAQIAKAPSLRGHALPSTACNIAASSSRLHSDHSAKLERLRLKQRQLEENERLQLESSRARALPTRSASDVSLNRLTVERSVEIGRRLYGDAERRIQERLNREESELLSTSKISTSRSCVLGPDPNTSRTLNLYHHAEERQRRFDLKRQENEAVERDCIARHAVPCGDGQRAVDMDRISSLHREHVERARRVALEVEKKRTREREEMQPVPYMVRSSSSTTIPRPSSRAPKPRQPLYPGGSARRQKSEEPSRDIVQADAITPADHLVTCISAAVQARTANCPCALQPPDMKAMTAPLRAAMTHHREALARLERCDGGLAALAARPSQRLFGERLLPDVEGRARRVEPDPICQPTSDLLKLLRAAELAQEQLKSTVALAPGAPWPRGDAKSQPGGVPDALFAFDPGTKGEGAARVKASALFGPGDAGQRHRHVLDLARMALVFPSCDMLQAGLEHIIRRFQVLSVANYFRTPTRLGARFVRVLVLIRVGDGADKEDHVCEMQLEHQLFHKARLAVERHIDEAHMVLRAAFSSALLEQDVELIVYISRSVLSRPHESRRLRAFRCHLARRYGSTISAWRGDLAGHRCLQFARLREVCNLLSCSEHTSELWEEMDPGFGASISLWELDSEALSVLLRFRQRLLQILDCQAGTRLQPDAAERAYARLACHIRPTRPGQLEAHEFRACCKPLGIGATEADRAFAFLDPLGGSSHTPPALVGAEDVAWVLRLDALLDVAAASLSPPPGSPGSPKKGGHQEAWSPFSRSATPLRLCSARSATPVHPRSARASPKRIAVCSPATSPAAKPIEAGEPQKRLSCIVTDTETW